MWERFIDNLPTAAQSPFAALLYVCLLAAYVFVVVYTHRLKRISESLALVPENERAALLAKEYSTFPRSGVSPDHWLASRRQLFIFLAFLATLVAATIIFIMSINQATGQQSGINPQTSTGDVALRFVYPTDPSLIVVNPSNSVIRDIKWAVELWNVNLPDRDDPLPIPISTIEWIKPHEGSGPLDLFDSPIVRPLLKLGDHLLGSASVNCAECIRGRSYVVDIVWGKDGSFSELENETSGKFLSPLKLDRQHREAFFNSLERIPTKDRVPITQR